MPYIYLMAPNGATVQLTSTQRGTIKAWFDEWLPKFTGWAGGEPCTIRCTPVAEQHDEEPADWWTVPTKSTLAGPAWWYDWPADNRVIGGNERFWAKTGLEGLEELDQLRNDLVIELDYLEKGGHPYWKCPSMSSEEIKAGAVHPCLARYMAVQTPPAGPLGDVASWLTQTDVEAATARLAARRGPWPHRFIEGHQTPG